MLLGAAVFLWPLSAITHVLSRSKQILLLTNPTVSLYLSPLLTLNFVAICLTNTSISFPIPPDVLKTASYDAARAYIKRQLKDGPIKHARTATVYKHLNRKRDSVAVKSRKDGALLAQLRSGHCLKLQEYRNRIGLEDSPTCPTCGEEDQDVGHWLLRCPGTLPARQSLFDNVRCMSLGTLCENPKKILELAKMTLRSD